jgi:hypothetical protein
VLMTMCMLALTLRSWNDRPPPPAVQAEPERPRYRIRVGLQRGVNGLRVRMTRAALPQ